QQVARPRTPRQARGRVARGRAPSARHRFLRASGHREPGAPGTRAARRHRGPKVASFRWLPAAHPGHGAFPTNLGPVSRHSGGRAAASANPSVSIVVVAYDIPRELPRTLRSLSASYQRGIAADEYEVIVVDNGSPIPLDESVFEGLEGCFRLVHIDDASPSPAGAANRGIREARADLVGVMIDGARLVTPGFVRFALAASNVHPVTAVATLGWYLGSDFQRHAMGAGWTRADEDRLLESISWPEDGYRLFEISTMDESSVDGWFYGAFESNALFLSRALWDEIGGFYERFDAPGGGMVNHDVFHRLTDRTDVGWVLLLGEAT